MEIPKEIVVKALEIYKPEQRILLEASMDYPLIRGKFLIGQAYYASVPVQHATDIEIQLCLNQLVYVGIEEIINKEIVPELLGINFEKYQKEGMLIVESRKRFRKPIRTDKEIFGEVEFKRFKSIKNLVFSCVNFNFENRRCFGSLGLVLVR